MINGGRNTASRYLASVDAPGGTELAAGLNVAAQLLGSDSGDVLELTDGQAAGAETILAEARTAGIRIHCMGIGSASQDRFLTLLARETGGVSRFMTARERVDVAAVEMFASITGPVARGLQVGTLGPNRVTFAPEPPHAIYPGGPLLLYGETNEAQRFTMRLSWDGPDGWRELDVLVAVDKSDKAGLVPLLQGALLIPDMEARIVA